MKQLICKILMITAAGSLLGCGGGTSAPAAAAVTPPPAQVTGLQTPKSVAVVTAN